MTDTPQTHPLLGTYYKCAVAPSWIACAAKEIAENLIKPGDGTTVAYGSWEKLTSDKEQRYAAIIEKHYRAS